MSESAPDFELRDQTETLRSLEGLFSAETPVVLLVFYPGDGTPVCTKQLKSYSKSLKEFESLGVKLVGISSDDPESHRDFIRTEGLAMDLLSDPGASTARAYGVQSKWFRGIPTRGVFLISRDRKILWKKIEATGLTHPKSDRLLSQVRAELQKLGPQ